jgi:hypothetical protein
MKTPGMVQYDVFLLLVFVFWCYTCCGEVCGWFVQVCLFHYLLSTLDLNDTGFSEGVEIFEYQEEDQGQADQGKPSILDAYLILFTYFASFKKIYQIACFYIAIVLVAITCWLKLYKPNDHHP